MGITDKVIGMSFDIISANAEKIKDAFVLVIVLQTVVLKLKNYM